MAHSGCLNSHHRGHVTISRKEDSKEGSTDSLLRWLSRGCTHASAYARPSAPATRPSGSALPEREAPTELGTARPPGVPLLWKPLAEDFDLIEAAGALARQTPRPGFCWREVFLRSVC